MNIHRKLFRRVENQLEREKEKRGIYDQGILHEHMRLIKMYKKAIKWDWGDGA
jgi:hypothetical protein